MNKSLKNFMAVTLALFGFMLGKACVEEPTPDLKAQNKLFSKKTAGVANRGIKRAIDPRALRRVNRRVAAKTVKDPRYKILVNNSMPWKGEKDALVTIVEFSDFQCPFCSRVEPTINQIMDKYKGQVKVVWMNNPLGFHKNAMPAAEAAYAIFKLKGDAAFWKAHGKFFHNQKKLSPDFYKEVAKELGVDMTQFENITSKHIYQKVIKSQQATGAKLGARGTPAFFINGKFLSGAQPFSKFKVVIDKELAYAKTILARTKNKAGLYNEIIKNGLTKKVAQPRKKNNRKRPGTPDPNKVYFNDISDAPFKGPKDALVTIVEYSDFQCPFCGRVEPTVDQVMKDYAGKVRVVWKNFPLGFHKNAMPAAEAAHAIYKLKGDVAFWKAHNKFFHNQRKLSLDFYKETAKELGVDMGKFENAISKHTYQTVIRKQMSEGSKVGTRGTPAFYINGKFLSGAQPIANFKRVIDKELKNAELMVKKGVAKNKIYETLMKKAERKLAAAPQRRRPNTPDPKKAYFNDIKNRPIKGAKDAIVTIVEYSDFQCPFCGRVEPTVDAVMKKYAGKVRVIWKNFPLGFHKNAMPAAEAMEAIYHLKGDAAFWKAHNKFFHNQRKLSPDFYKETAKELGVDMAKFNDANSKHTYQGLIKKQMSEASRVGTRGTPAFYINGKFLSGAQPLANFEKIIDQEIKNAEAMLKKGIAKNKIYETIMKTAEKKLSAGPAPKRRPGSPDPAKVYYNNLNGGPARGPKDALVTIVEYSDFQCPFCSRVEPTMDRIMKEYAGKVRIIWMNNPLGFHKNAMPAAEAAYSIYKLKGDKAFWKAHAKFFKNQRKLSSEFYTETAKELGVDMGKFENATSKHTYQGIIKSQQMQGAKIGARGTPAFFINGRFLSGARPFEHFKKLIDEELAKAQAMVKKGTSKSKIYGTLMKNAEKSVK